MDWKGKIDFEVLPQIGGVDLLSKRPNEWDDLAEKANLSNADILVIEDADDGYAKKRVEIGTIVPITDDSPADVDTNAASVGTSGELARADHKHDVSTAIATSVGASNAEGTSTSLARADHSHAVTDLSIASQEQGSVLYFDGSNWVELPPADDGYVLTTHDTGADPSWTSMSSGVLTSAAPIDVDTDPADVGTSAEAARADHKHDIATASAISVGSANAEGTSVSLARADHTHAVTDFNIASQEQGSVLYFDGANWVELPPADDGYVLTTHDTGSNPTWEFNEAAALSDVPPEDVDTTTASAGAADEPARRDHKHDIATASAISVGAANAEGTSASLARADHAHAVTDFSIAGQEQGSVLYFDGSNWIELSPDEDGYVLTTHDTGADPTWESVSSIILTGAAPEDIDTGPAAVGTSDEAARADHKHDADTAITVSVGATNAEGISLSLARADHTHAVTDLSIISQEQGSVLYFDGSNWVELAPSDDGYVLTTHSTGADPTWTSISSGVLTSAPPIDVDTDPADVGTSDEAARADHKHDIATASAISVGASNAEGTSTSLARSDHAHAVTDLAISSQEQGSVLYFDGSNWVQLPPSNDGYVLTTHDTGADPTWEFNEAGALSNTPPVDVDTDPADAGVSGEAARRDHKHDISTASATSVGSANTEGTSTSLTRADHTHAVTDLSITGQEQGSILYFDGSNWIELSPSEDGYILTTHDTGSDPTWESLAGSILTSAAPANVDTNAAVVGVSDEAARADHKHDTTTATAVSIGSANAEGTSVSLARADHTHAVTDFSIASQEQGSILYFDGSNWVELSPSNDGYVLTTHDTGSDPTWEFNEAAALSDTTPEDVDTTAASAGIADEAARRDHKHDVATASAVSVGVSNTEGASASLARADHTHAVTDLSISGQEQGSVLYFDGSNWIELSPSNDGYVLTTHDTGADPTWESMASGVLTDTAPIDVNTDPAGVGTSDEAARSDHKHDIATATGVSVGATNAEGTSTSLARADHTHSVTDLSIVSQEQGSVLYFDGSNWVELPPSDDGYVLTTHDTGSDPTWASIASGVITSAAPTDVDTDPADVGTSAEAARADHKHDISTASAISVGAANAEGTSQSLARADHIHAVADLAISGQEQGSVLYFDGSNWVELSPGDDGYVLTTHDTGADPTWEFNEAAALSNIAPEDVDTNVASAGVADEPARRDHKHDIDTASAVSVGATNAEGTSTSLARADHTHAVTDLAIASQEQGSVLYFDGSNWVELPPSDDGYVLTTHDTGADPSWNSIASGVLTNATPVDVDTDPADVGTSTEAARADHKHDVSTASATSVGAANAEGTSISLARADHTHAVTDLAIASQEQGSVLYFDGSNWVELSPGEDGYVLTTHDIGADPTWEFNEAGALSNTPPADVDTTAADAGVSGEAARRDHKHDVLTASAVSVGAANTEGTSASLARADHTHAVTDLSISGQEQGSVLYFDGSNWVELSPGDDGYVLTTHDTGADPTWEFNETAALSNTSPEDVDTNAASAGSVEEAARRDHKHDVATASAVSVGAANAEGTSSSLARADHTHAVTDLSIASQEQGSVLYFDGSNWVELSPGSDGYVLTTHDTGADPTWEFNEAAALSDVPPEDVDTNTASAGVADEPARRDHKHDIDTATAVSVGATSSEGTSVSLARADHTHAVTDLSIASQEQGSVLYFDGSNWVELPPSDDGYVLTTHDTGADPTWESMSAGVLTNTAPVDVDTDPADVGSSDEAARADHKHDVSTAAAGTISVGDASAEGTSTSLARSDHTHALTAPSAPANVTKSAASAGAATTVARSDHKHDVSTAVASSVGATNAEGASTSLARADHTHAVTDLAIASQEQGSVLYFDGSNWVELPPSDDGYVLTTHDTGADPTWEETINTPLTSAAPEDVDTAAASVGVSSEAARADHKHDTSTASAVSVGATNAEGTSTSLARADHTHAVTDLSIASQEQGSVLYFDGSNWEELPPGEDGYVLTTHDTGADPTWEFNEAGALSDTPPVDVDTDPAAAGVSGEAARRDHKHDVATASAVSVGAANAEGSSQSLARADHTHAVTDLNIASQEQGSVLYFDGSNWVELPPSDDGYVLTTHDTGADPTWEPDNGAEVTNTAPEDVDTNAAVVGTSAEAARADHKHDVSTASAISVGATNAEGTSASLARADHTHSVTDLAIASQEQGSIIYFDGSNWVELPPADDGYVLTTHDTGADPTWEPDNGAEVTDAAPVDIDTNSAVVGVSSEAARADHKHDVATATASSTGATNSEGSSASLARADHTHAVTDLAIASQEQGSILYFDGSNWAELPPSDDGYVLTTHDTGSDPTWEFNEAGALSDTAPVDVDTTAASAGVSTEAARQDHKHDVATAAAVSVGTTNAEGTSASLARADHTHAVTDLVIASQEQGSVLYFDGSNWVELPPSDDGYVLTTHDTGADPTWEPDNGAEVTSTPPADIDTAAAVVGVSDEAARADHKHDVDTAAAGTISVGDASAEGTSLSLARADHTHALTAPAAPADVTKAAASAGVATTVARSDHKHNISTASATSVGAANAEGTSSSLARADHTHAVTDLSIASQEQGSILYFDGSNWVELPPSDDGYVLTTHDTGADPTWEETISTPLTDTAPVDVDTNVAAVGVSDEAARSDHKHDVATASAVSVGAANAEGASTSLARADHTHAVTDLNIASQEQGSILYFDGSNWVELPPSTDGYVLSTNGTGADPEWISIGGGTGDVTGPGSSTDNAVAKWNGATGDTIQNSGVIIDDLDNVTIPGDVDITDGDLDVQDGYINGHRHYDAAGTDPSSPTPQAGDRYYNTSLDEEMRYDGSRDKWLGVSKMTFQAGTNGNTQAGNYYMLTDGLAMDASNRGIPVPKGTLVSIAISRTDADASTLEVLVNGSVIATLAHAAAGDTRDDTIDADFAEGRMAFRNISTGNTTSNVHIVAVMKQRA